MIDSYSTPCFVMEQPKLESNLAKLGYLQDQTGVKILLTLKCFNNREGLEVISKSISGFSAGNQRELDKLKTIEYQYIHTYAPAFRSNEIEDLVQRSNTMSFNSLRQWKRYASIASTDCSIGLRINPQLTLKQPKYCNPNSAMRLGVTNQSFLQAIANTPHLFQNLEGLHFHVFCSQGLSGLKYLLAHIIRHYQEILPRLKWLNLGGGHNLTDKGYDHEGFIALINAFTSQYPNLTIILEPGESVVRNSGYFITTILDIIPGEIPIVILDTSIEAHLLDVAITKQKPAVRETALHPTHHRYRLSGMSCIAGDIIGDYYFEKTLEINDNIIFENMMGYTIVKQTEFNGIAKADFRLIR
ncbi:MAG: carboxynorspermidine decarboxylase [Campylobacterota bacterium]|nr:carboxynorspermidine decarboxylase [Campylobacterota bacterium]